MGRKRKPFSDEHKRKISKTLMGRKLSVEVIRKLSGSNSSSWKGGISFEPYSSEFTNQLKEYIRERDNYVCQLCGKKQRQNSNNKKLSVHHIDYNKQNCYPKNLISLCRVCHAEVNSDRKAWTRIFRRRIKNIYIKKQVI